MPWNSTSPLGTVSVKANEVIGQENTTYIETTMGKSIVGTNTVDTRDHFWAVDPTLDGRHRFVQSPAFTVGGNPEDPVLASAQNGILYVKTTNGTVQGFYRNNEGIYQYIPTFVSGVVNIPTTSNFETLVPVPANVYGEIFIWHNNSRNIQQATFMSGGTVVEAFSQRQKQVGTSDDYFVEFLNGSGAVDLNIKARRGNDSSGNYLYRITYRAI